MCTKARAHTRKYAEAPERQTDRQRQRETDRQTEVSGALRFANFAQLFDSVTE